MKNRFISSIVSSFLISNAIAGTTTVPDELQTNVFADASMAPCPAVLGATPYGDLFVGVDTQGSLGTKPNLGYITKLIDTDKDGKADKRTIYAKVDNPRGLIAIGDRLIALHSVQKNGIIENQQLSVFFDKDNDGVADGPAKPLVTNIGNPKFLKSRGTDHSTNNIRLGIDGWIYISIGDFGFIDAEGTDGTKLSMHGGGIVRVRPDGSEMETFIHGTRNVYDVAIDPFMNVVTRENTNDGIGWWTRFSHYIQSGEYGYPSLYTNFPEDMLPALGEYGGGSGCGNMYFEEPGWPEKYNKTFMMTDWGRSHIYIHRVEKDGASFTDKPEDFIGCTQITDIDTDASGRMYLSAWDGAGYKGNPNKGFISIVTPKDWKYKAFPALNKLSATELVDILKTSSSTARVYAQQEILHRNKAEYFPLLEKLTLDQAASNETRTAALFSFAQLADQLGYDKSPLFYKLVDLKDDAVMREQAVRMMADRLNIAKNVPVETIKIFKNALNDSEPRVQVAAAVALGRTRNLDVVNDLIAKAIPPAKKVIKVNKTMLEKAIEVKGGESVEIDVDISTFTQLYLIVDGSGDNTNDQVAWINPVVHQKFDKSTDMTKYKWKSAKQGKGKTLINKTAYGKPLPNGAKGIGTHANSVISYKIPPKSVTFTATGILTNPQGKGSAKFIVSSSPKIDKANSQKVHSTPHKEIILPHVAMQSLLALGSEDGCIAALQSGNEDMQRGALAAMKFMHSDKVVDALISEAEKKTALKSLIVSTLIRLHQKEVDYDGSTWWSTRPDPKGPYFYPTDWSSTEKISNFLNKQYETLNEAAKKTLKNDIKKNKAYVPGMNPRPVEPDGKKVAKVGKTSIEDLVLHASKHKGNPKNGAKVINKVGCIACHGVKIGDVVKGPDLTILGNMSDEDLTEAIIKPGATIAPTWITATMKDKSSHVGTIIKKDKKELILHNIGGIPTTIDATQIVTEEPGPNMMSLHLCDDLTLNEFSDLLAYIKSMDKRKKK